ncbi:MAG: dienelactone hydrolase family protein [Clostridia bacterium]|nr:dienelactone hydrolase family protein [Clostridia bacterium]
MFEQAFSPYLDRLPPVTYVPDFDPHSHPDGGENQWDGIRALTFDGAPCRKEKTKVFAYIGFPAGASAAAPVPGVVLVHGGGGHAFAEWVKIWNDRGYAAIAMDTTGCYPSETGQGRAGRESDYATDWWRHGLYGPFAQPGYTDGPDNDEMASSGQPWEEQWMPHAIVATMGARNILAADPRVDAAKIGITGVSWGGVITSLVIGYDPHYAFAIPIYGSAYLDVSLGWMGPIFSAEQTRAQWSAASRLHRVACPVLWMDWASDTPFSINSNSLSYEATKAAGARHTAKVTMGHSHAGGWTQEEGYIFADAAIGRRCPLTAMGDEPAVSRNEDGTYTVTATIIPAADGVEIAASLVYITAPLSYSNPGEKSTAVEQTWQTVSCRVEAGRVIGILPPEAKEFYLSVTTVTAQGTYEVCSRFVQGI